MNEPTSTSLNQELEQYRPMLLVLAQLQIGKKLRRKLDPEDLVQEVMQRAYTHFPAFEFPNDSEKVKAWLLVIMGNVIKDLLKHFSANKRELAKEQSVALDLKQSAVGIEAFLAAEQSTPSLVASRNEELLKLAKGLELIPEDSREVIVLKHLQNKSLQEIAGFTGRSVPSVAGLLRRGLARLREHLT
ncbi:MAG: sigma-70 family RNA polymerase sigma factor [Planctomycetales bacterium]|nr:sigma-70 family RNA polymerase sigma factor [Planctomycetales bacterium]